METRDFAAELVRLARAEIATPEGRLRVARALRRTLALIEPDEPVSFAIAEIEEMLSLASEHVVFLKARLTAAPPRREPEARPGYAADRSPAP